MNVFKNLKNKIKEVSSKGLFFTVAGFILILCLSWFYLSQSLWNNEIEEQVHGNLQNRFQVLIADFVAKKHPEVTEITFHRVWTKNTSNSNEIKIFFNYTLLTEGESGGELLISGEALLQRSSEKESLWVVQNFQVTDSFLDFSEPLLIKAGPQPENS